MPTQEPKRSHPIVENGDQRAALNYIFGYTLDPKLPTDGNGKVSVELVRVYLADIHAAAKAALAK